MRRTKRRFLQTVGSGVASLGFLSGVSGASSNSVDPEDVHQEDKFTISKEKYKNKRPDLREFVKESKILEKKAKGKEDFIIFANPKKAKKEVDFVELSTSSDKSISAQIRESKKWERQEKKIKKNKKKVDEDVKKSKKEAWGKASILATDTVEIGEDTELVSCDIGDSGNQGVFGDKKSDARTNNDTLHEEITIIPTVGDAWAWAYLADEFEVTGGGEEVCNVSSHISYQGYLQSALGAVAEIDVTWKLENLDSGETWDGTHLSKTWTSTTSNGYTGTDVDSVSVVLTSGDTYRLTVRSEGHVSVTGPQGAQTDFGSQMDGEQMVDVEKFSFNFAN